MLGFPLLYFKGMRLLMFQLSGFYYMKAPGNPCSRMEAFREARRGTLVEELSGNGSVGVPYYSYSIVVIVL